MEGLRVHLGSTWRQEQNQSGHSFVLQQIRASEHCRHRETPALEPDSLGFKSQVCYLSAGGPGTADLTNIAPQCPHLELR